MLKERRNLIYKRYCYFSNRSILCPPISSLIFDHLSNVWSASSYSEQLHKWGLQCSSVYGIFEGVRPVYVVSDTNPIIRSNRLLGQDRLHVFATNSNEQWKRQRTILNPTFSTSKMKRLLPMMNSSINIFIAQLFMKTNENKINILDFYKRLTIDIICKKMKIFYQIQIFLFFEVRCAFGIGTQVQHDINHENIYMKKVQEVLGKDFGRSYLARIHRIMSCSFLANLCSFLFRRQYMFEYEKSSLPANFWLINHIHQFIQERFQKNHQQTTNDLLQLMIDALQSDKNQLSSSELLNKVYLMLAAGFATTSTALGYCTYRLAIHQDIQEKIYRKIIKYKSSDFNSHETITNKLIYMDIYIREVLRMHPIAIQPVHRQCMQDTYVDKSYFEKGTLIQVGVLSLHYDNEYWGPEPVLEFYPERHACKRHPLAFMPFGGGPRICRGIRFAFHKSSLFLHILHV
ncbi:unnamed protein product [Rotaria socialis]|uniref:Cytochrome P450 n=1 Tax=Rotaria socialis TaxID=392032 RepID=A0A818UA43_9BILA|nr:unnamed protein product [Rotaria socialis]